MALHRLSKHFYLFLLPVSAWIAFRERWISDDAFISFRYAENAAAGLGLVYNAGEQVEGYTNFLWTLILTAGIFLKADPVLISYAAGILFWLLSLISVYLFSNQMYKNTAGGFFFPAAFLSWGLHHHGAVYATSGLETMMFTFLITSSYLILLSKQASGSDRGILSAFFLLNLAAMTRPEGILYLAYAGIYSSVSRAYKKRLILFLSAAAVLFVPYFLWRWNYYGWLFPNTFYAKSGGGSWWLQGFKYFILYFQAYYILLIPVMTAAVLIPLKICRWPRNSDHFASEFRLMHWAFLSVPFLIHILYIIRVGGDFMFARFFIPVTPFLLTGMEILIRDSTGKSLNLRRPASVLLILMPFLIFFYPDPLKRNPVQWGIVHENKVYKRQLLEPFGDFFTALSPFFRENEIRIAIDGAYAYAAFYLKSPYTVEAVSGLTDEFIAHLPVQKRARPGHEKQAPPHYIVSRGIHLHTGVHAHQHYTGRIVSFTHEDFPGFEAEFTIVQYSRELEAALIKPRPDGIRVKVRSIHSE